MGDLHDNVRGGRSVWVHCLTAVHMKQYRLAAATAAPADFLAVNEAAPAVPGTRSGAVATAPAAATTQGAMNAFVATHKGVLFCLRSLR